MCGIFGLFNSETSTIDADNIKKIIDRLFILSESRGKEAAGISIKTKNAISVLKEPWSASKFIRSKKYMKIFQESFSLSKRLSKNHLSCSIICHSRLVTNGKSELNSNNQPVVKDGAIGVHNGIIVNETEIWNAFPELNKTYNVDTESLLSLLQFYRKKNFSLTDALTKTFNTIEGSASIAVLFDDNNIGILASNTGSLFTLFSKDKSTLIFASEKHILIDFLKNSFYNEMFDVKTINQVKAGSGLLINLQLLEVFQFFFQNSNNKSLPIHWSSAIQISKVPILNHSSPDLPQVSVSNIISEKNKSEMMTVWKQLYSGQTPLKRCTRCLLPETLPFITFDKEGVCNHCRKYEMQGSLVNGERALKNKVEKYRSKNGESDCLIGFSGGRDSSYGLYYIKSRLELNPITFIYDWGMVTDLARRNQARVCGKLGIEQIVVSADIKKKRENIRKNLEAWIKKPDLGMIPILMAGDKEFYHYFHKIRRDNDIKLFIFCGGYEGEESTGIFKLGFCGIDRDKGSAEHRMTGISLINKLRLIFYYAKNYLKNPGYINSSAFDTLYAFYSSYILPDDYLYLFNYLQWNEKEIVTTIINEFNWELETDTIATWRTDDGTAAIYNYMYMTMAAFTEFDLIRSQQIRDGQLTRQEALAFIREENKPRFHSIEWYAQTVGVDVNKVIEAINGASRLYE